MLTSDRRKLIAGLLASSKAKARAEAEFIKAQRDLKPEFLYVHLKNYTLYKYMLPLDCQEENIMALAALSIQRSLKVDKNTLQELDRAAPCNKATSGSTKKVLLLYAIQTDLQICPDPVEYAAVQTLRELSDLIYKYLTV